MLINENIIKICSKNNDICEIKHLDNTVWKEQNSIILTNVADSYYFNKTSKGRYKLKETFRNKITVMYLANKYKDNLLAQIYKEIAGMEIMIPRFGDQLFEESELIRMLINKNRMVGELQDIEIEILIDNKLSNTVVLVQRDENFNEEEEKQKVIEMFTNILKGL